MCVVGLNFRGKARALARARGALHNQWSVERHSIVAPARAALPSLQPRLHAGALGAVQRPPARVFRVPSEPDRNPSYHPGIEGSQRSWVDSDAAGPERCRAEGEVRGVGPGDFGTREKGAEGRRSGRRREYAELPAYVRWNMIGHDGGAARTQPNPDGNQLRGWTGCKEAECGRYSDLAQDWYPPNILKKAIDGEWH